MKYVVIFCASVLLTLFASCLAASAQSPRDAQRSFALKADPAQAQRYDDGVRIHSGAHINPPWRPFHRDVEVKVTVVEIAPPFWSHGPVRRLIAAVVRRLFR